MNRSPSSPPVPPPPASPIFHVRTLFKLRPAGRRWPFAARAALCMGAPVLAGWGAGDVPAGLVATIGAFTALYGSDRPYLNRALYLALIAISFAVAVALGVWAAETKWLAVLAIVVIAMTATFLCNALRVSPRGAYMFALACAAGTAVPVDHLSSLQIGLLVFAGGAFAWLVHVLGALFWPRGPERAAVAAAGQAVARFVEAIGTVDEDTARHQAALAVHASWTALVSHQPAHPRPDGTLSRLRALNRELNLLFVSAMNTSATAASPPAGIADKARRLATLAADKLQAGERTDPNHIPLGHHGALASLRQNLRPWSPSLVVTARVGVAAAIAGTIGAAFGLERAYWTTAAAVLILHQGLDWIRSLQRGAERMIGTLAGLVLAGAILAIHPQGPWLILTLMLLQFVIEMSVVRNYALAVVFITAAALTIASGGHPVPDIGHLLWVRGVDTVIGCAIGLLVLMLTTPRALAMRIPQELVTTMAMLSTALDHAADGDVTSPVARQSRRDLQVQTIALLEAYDSGVGATPRQREIAERMWPAVVATQRLVYRVLSVCWSLENAGPEAAPETARALFGADGRARLQRALAGISAAIRGREKPAEIGLLPAFVESELRNLSGSLVYTPE